MIKVAVIEDKPAVRNMFIELIDSTPGYVCVCACATVKDALVEIPRHQPDVALTDVLLPDESGIACAALLTEKLPGLQVIMVTACADPGVASPASEAGACVCVLGNIFKRSRPQEIIQAIAGACADGASPMASQTARMLSRSFRELPAASSGNGLTAREADILEFLAEGFSNKEIAQKTGISVGTVRTHVGHIYSKLHVQCRTEAAAKFFRTRQATVELAGHIG